jgi:LuxR family maltose regulon positive regulatory protein
MEMLSAPWLGRIQLALQHHRLDQATDLLELGLATVPVRPRLSVKLRVLQTLVQHRQGHSRRALRTLQRARETARAGGRHGALLDEGATLDQVPGVEKHCAVPHCVVALRWVESDNYLGRSFDSYLGRW